MTYFTQEMLKKGFLAGGQVATSYAYNQKIINKYLKTVDIVFEHPQMFRSRQAFNG